MYGVEVLAKYISVVEHLTKGAHRATASYSYDWESGTLMRTPSLTRCGQAANLAILKARALLDEGKGSEAVGVLLDLAQFGRDVGSNGPMISELTSVGLISQALEEFRTGLTSGVLDPEALGLAERGLELLDRSLPRRDLGISDDALLIGIGQLEAGSGHIGSRLLAAEAYDRVIDWGRRLAEAEGRSWQEVGRVEVDIYTQAKGSWNPLTKLVGPRLLGTGRPLRVLRAHLRLLRAAIHARRGEEGIELQDPFGTTLKSLSEGKTFRVWSVGTDGRDHGGQGGWNAAEGKDLLLEIER